MDSVRLCLTYIYQLPASAVPSQVTGNLRIILYDHVMTIGIRLGMWD